MAIAMLAVVRANALEPVFGGLDRAVRFHRVLGPSAILLLIAHVVFLALAEFQDGGSLGDLFIPFWSPSTRSIDILAFYALLLLGRLAYDRYLPVRRDVPTHPARTTAATIAAAPDLRPLAGKRWEQASPQRPLH